MHASRFLVIAAVALTALGASAADARTSHAQLWETANGAIACGYKAHPRRQPPTVVLCSSALVPPPRGRAGNGDPGFVQLARSGGPRRLRLSQDSFVHTRVTVLRPGSTWSGLGVICAAARAAVSCHNARHHGFTITASKFRAY
jgi:hypothetical protein